MNINMFGYLIPGIREIAKNNGAALSLKARWPEIRKGYKREEIDIFLVESMANDDAYGDIGEYIEFLCNG